MKLTNWLPALPYVPHDPPMCLIDNIVEYDDDFIVCELTIDLDSVFLTDKGVPAWVGVEYMAQSVAAYAGMQSKLNGQEVQPGLLVSARKYQCNVGHFMMGQQLFVKATQSMGFGEGELAVFDCSIMSKIQGESDIQASVSMNVFQPNDIKEYIKQWQNPS